MNCMEAARIKLRFDTQSLDPTPAKPVKGSNENAKSVAAAVIDDPLSGGSASNVDPLSEIAFDPLSASLFPTGPTANTASKPDKAGFRTPQVVVCGWCVLVVCVLWCVCCGVCAVVCVHVGCVRGVCAVVCVHVVCVCGVCACGVCAVGCVLWCVCCGVCAWCVCVVCVRVCCGV